MFTICTDYIENGKIKEYMDQLPAIEKKFTKKIGVIYRKFFQCEIQPHIIWAFTEWVSEKHHNDAAQSIMKTRRDDRFATIKFGPVPYFEIFCEEDKSVKIGKHSDKYKFIIAAHVVISDKVKEKYLKLRKERVKELKSKIPWLSVYHNTYNPSEFVAFLGFRNEKEFKKARNIGELLLEEYLFTGLRDPLGMSYIAAYNQFICKPLLV